MKRLFAPAALLPHGWADDVLLEVADDGALAAVTPGAEPPAEAERLPGPVVPGVPNLHSHAFQRAMAGLAEVAGPADDSFWTWRQVMYGFLARLTPDDVGAIARLLYIDMLKAGYTAVGEFHYLHHGPDGTPYADRAELSERVIAAARSAGIGITHLPVLYGNNGFGGAAPSDGQRRFLNSPDALLGLVDTLKSRHGANPDVAVGVAPHSLRATTPEALAAAVAGVPDGPIHIHIAEQTREVDECLAWSGTRPVDWLFDHHAVDGRWCLVHATHVTPAEAARLAISGAVAGLCPTTEANLGDGLFPVTDYAAAGGVMGIGSDSHVTVDPAQEMRWLEYGPRLVQRGRNLLAGAPGASTGRVLFDALTAGGAQALARPIGRLAPGHRADLLVLDADDPSLAARTGDALLNAWLFAAHRPPIRHVMVSGEWWVRDGRHGDEGEAAADYRKVMGRLLAG